MKMKKIVYNILLYMYKLFSRIIETNKQMKKKLNLNFNMRSRKSDKTFTSNMRYIHTQNTHRKIQRKRERNLTQKTHTEQIEKNEEEEEENLRIQFVAKKQTTT